MDPVTRWLHMLGVGTYVGTTLGLLFVVLPAAARMDDPAEQRKFLTKWLTPYNVISIGALLVLIMTGASAITDLKAMLRGDFARLFQWLLLKLSLSFTLIFMATWLGFGLAHRIVGAERRQAPIEPEWQRSILARMRGGAWLCLALAGVTAWVGTWFRG
jgi:uncharacterized membrane protein